MGLLRLTLMSYVRFEPAKQPPEPLCLSPVLYFISSSEGTAGSCGALAWQYQHLLCLRRARGSRFIVVPNKYLLKGCMDK